MCVQPKLRSTRRCPYRESSSWCIAPTKLCLFGGFSVNISLASSCPSCQRYDVIDVCGQHVWPLWLCFLFFFFCHRRSFRSRWKQLALRMWWSEARSCLEHLSQPWWMSTSKITPLWMPSAITCGTSVPFCTAATTAFAQRYMQTYAVWIFL